MDPVGHSLFFPLHRVTLGSLDLEACLASMAAMVPLGVLAFLDQMGFLAYLDCLYVPPQMCCSVVTKAGFAFCDFVGEVTAKYLGRIQITLSLLALLELNFLTHSEDKMKILWIKSPPSPAAIFALDAAQDMGGFLGCKPTLTSFSSTSTPKSFSRAAFKPVIAQPECVVGSCSW